MAVKAFENIDEFFIRCIAQGTLRLEISVIFYVVGLLALEAVILFSTHEAVFLALLADTSSHLWIINLVEGLRARALNLYALSSLHIQVVAFDAAFTEGTI